MSPPILLFYLLPESENQILQVLGLQAIEQKDQKELHPPQNIETALQSKEELEKIHKPPQPIHDENQMVIERTEPKQDLQLHLEVHQNPVVAQDNSHVNEAQPSELDFRLLASAEEDSSDMSVCSGETFDLIGLEPSPSGSSNDTQAIADGNLRSPNIEQSTLTTNNSGLVSVTNGESLVTPHITSSVINQSNSTTSTTTTTVTPDAPSHVNIAAASSLSNTQNIPTTVSSSSCSSPVTQNFLSFVVVSSAQIYENLNMFRSLLPEHIQLAHFGR